MSDCTIKLDTVEYKNSIKTFSTCYTTTLEKELNYQLSEELQIAFNKAFDYIRSPISMHLSVYLFARELFVKAILGKDAMYSDTNRKGRSSTIEQMKAGFKKLQKLGLVNVEYSDNEEEAKSKALHWQDYSVRYQICLTKGDKL